LQAGRVATRLIEYFVGQNFFHRDILALLLLFDPLTDKITMNLAASAQGPLLQNPEIIRSKT
jgi:hypothetical protein